MEAVLLRETNRRPPVYLLEPGPAADSYGDPIPDWTHPVPTLIPGADIQTHLTLDKDEANSTSVYDTGTLIVIGGDTALYARIKSNSRLEQDGVVWRINGDPNYKPGRMAGNDHLTASLIRKVVEEPGA